jgi:hypothetical protein
MAASNRRAATPASWKKGQSGNPKGRKPDAELARVRSVAAKTYGELEPVAKETLEDVMVNGSSESARVAAAREVLDRALGKAPATLDVEGVESMGIRQLLALLPEALKVLEDLAEPEGDE